MSVSNTLIATHALPQLEWTVREGEMKIIQIYPELKPFYQAGGGGGGGGGQSCTSIHTFSITVHVYKRIYVQDYQIHVVNNDMCTW